MNDDRARDAWVAVALDRFEAPLTGYAARLTGDLDAARDVVQDTFLRLLKESPQRVEPILAQWLFAVCRNRAVDVRRRGRHMPVTNTAALDSSPARNGSAAGTAERREEVSRAHTAIATLAEGQQEVLRLKFAHGLSYKEIAAVTGLSVSHVGVKVHEGIKALRARLHVAPPTPAPQGGAR